MYISESAPPHIRGFLVTIFNSSIAGGQCIAGLIDAVFITVPYGWRYHIILSFHNGGGSGLLQVVADCGG